jgi:PAS domain-containing protein
MHDHAHHKDLMGSLTREYKELLTNSEQPIYVYLDDEHKICNKKFAALLGYDSEIEWEKAEGSFPELFVDVQSRATLVSAYQSAMEQGMGSVNSIIWKKKDGDTIEASVILVPIVFKEHFFALHFVV